jgi:hypothetical protein
MTHRSLDRIYTKLVESSKLNISKVFVIEAEVEEVDSQNGLLMVKSIDTNRRIRCIAHQDISQLEVKDLVRIMGKLEFLNTTGLEAVIRVEYLCSIDATSRQEDVIGMYQKMKKNLSVPKVQNHLNIVHTAKCPIWIKNIGLIVPKDDLSFINQFNALGCVGNLYIYQVGSLDSIDYNIIKAFYCFQKYHQIDLVCIALGDISTVNAYKLSSRSLISTIINRKNYPYLITCISNKCTPAPFLNQISNRHFNSADDSIRFIHKIQTDHKKKIINSISECKARLHLKLSEFKNKLASLEAVTSDISDIIVCPSNKSLVPVTPNKTKLDSFRSFLIVKLKEQLLVLNRFEKLSAHDVIEKQRIDLARCLQKLQQPQGTTLNSNNPVNPSNPVQPAKQPNLTPKQPDLTPKQPETQPVKQPDPSPTNPPVSNGPENLQ